MVGAATGGAGAGGRRVRQAIGAAARLRIVEVDGEDLLELAARLGLVAGALGGVGEEKVRAQRVLGEAVSRSSSGRAVACSSLSHRSSAEAHGDARDRRGARRRSG